MLFFRLYFLFKRLLPFLGLSIWRKIIKSLKIRSYCSRSSMNIGEFYPFVSLILPLRKSRRLKRSVSFTLFSQHDKDD